MSGERGNSHTNQEIGRTLERARAELGLSLWQVEEATKIRAKYLRDLERENFEVLPAVYVLGSLKTYADYLGLDGEAMVRELKNRQAPPPEARDPEPEESTRSRRGGFLAALLGGSPAVEGRDAVEDPAPATAPRYGSRLHLGFGAVLILVLAVVLGAIFGDGGYPAVSQLREPATSEAPSRIAFSGEAQDTGNADSRAAQRAKSPDNGGDEDKQEDERDRGGEQGQGEKKDQDVQDGTPPEDTADVAVNLPASITASASASAAASSIPAASASASASSAATAPAASATASSSAAATVPASTMPADDAPGPPVDGPAVGQPTTGAAGGPTGPPRVVGADGARSVERIVSRVRIVRSFVRVR